MSEVKKKRKDTQLCPYCGRRFMMNGERITNVRRGRKTTKQCNYCQQTFEIRVFKDESDKIIMPMKFYAVAIQDINKNEINVIYSDELIKKMKSYSLTTTSRDRYGNIYGTYQKSVELIWKDLITMIEESSHTLSIQEKENKDGLF